jgi:hypothetical protein
VFHFQETSKSQRPKGLRTKHSKGALFPTVDICNPPVQYACYIRVEDDDRESSHGDCQIPVMSCREGQSEGDRGSERFSEILLRLPINSMIMIDVSSVNRVEVEKSYSDS